MMIDTQESNVPARKFFERQGFGSIEAHVYFSKVMGPDDTIDSEERVLRQSSLPSDTAAQGGSRDVARPNVKVGVKVSRLFRFKRAHSLLNGGLAKGAAGASAAAAAAAASEEAGIELEADKPQDKKGKGKGKGGGGKAGRKAPAPSAAGSAKRPRRAASRKK